MNFEDKTTGLITAIIMLLIMYGIFKWEQYKFRDCKNVGHATLYCIFKIGK